MKKTKKTTRSKKRKRPNLSSKTCKTKKRFGTKLLVSLTLLSSDVSFAQDSLNLNPVETHKVEQLLLDGVVCTDALKNTREAYQVCIDDHHPRLSWWQKPEIEIAGGVTLTFVGFFIGITHCFGTCR